MTADGLTNALEKDNYQKFVRLLQMEDITTLLQSLRRAEELRERLLTARIGKEVNEEFSLEEYTKKALFGEDALTSRLHKVRQA
ncbi:hypothetical protein DL765_007008 [Monosporascus sp. GIB2]|nr:hypothetical protein DL765_007008 [Monosporascus sp. GIB2]